MSQLRKVEILMTHGYTDHLTNVKSMIKDGDWVYFYFTTDQKITYRADCIIRIDSRDMVYE